MFRGLVCLVIIGGIQTTAAAQPSVGLTGGDDFWARLDRVCSSLKSLEVKDLPEESQPAAEQLRPYCVDPDQFPAIAADLEQRDAALETVEDSVGVPHGLTANGGAGLMAEGFADMALRGLATVLIKRAKAELQEFITDSIRSKVCTATLTKWVENTCEYLGSSDALGVTIGAGLRAAITSDVTALPQRAVDAIDAKGTATALVARVLLEAVLELPERLDLGMLGRRWQAIADRWECTKVDDGCSELKTALVDACKILQIVADITRPSFALADLAVTLKVRIDALGLSATLEQATHVMRLARIALGQVDSFLAADPTERRAQLGPLMRSMLAVADAVLQLTGGERAVQLLRVAENAADLLEAAAAGDLAAVFTQVLVHVRKLGSPVPADVARVLALGVELSTAKTSEEVEAAIESVAAPMGSYRRKRERFTVSLVGMVGLAWSNEAIPSSEFEGGSSWGPTGMVGVDFTGPMKTRYLTLGGFVSLLDLGTILSDQSTGDGAMDTQPASTEVEQLFAPGIHLRVGSKAVGPLVLLAGVSWIPNYREAGGQQVDVRRFTIGAAIDVTLWIF